MAISAEDLINVVCHKAGITRDSTGQFMSKQELLMLAAHLEKQEMHIRSLKSEVDAGRNNTALAEAVKAVLKEEGLING